jgi:hypothetical protein
MTETNDHIILILEVDEDGELSLNMAGYYPNKDANIFASLTALGYGILAILQDDQEQVAYVGLDYMKENGITFEGTLANTKGNTRLH